MTAQMHYAFGNEPTRTLMASLVWMLLVGVLIGIAGTVAVVWLARRLVLASERPTGVDVEAEGPVTGGPCERGCDVCDDVVQQEAQEAASWDEWVDRQI